MLNKSGNSLLLRSRIVLPIRRPPIEDGAVIIAGNKIKSVGRWRSLRRDFSGKILDLGERILMPGLVNAHCHLDYTDMAGLFPPTRKFTDWIKLITTEKAHWTFSDYAQSWLNGAKMLLRSGTTTVADIESVPELLPDVWHSTPLRVLSLLEMTGVRSRREPKTILSETLRVIGSLPDCHCAAGLSPHAPYSTMPALLKLVATTARKSTFRVAIHVAESAVEFDMFKRRRGEMFHWLQRNERDMSDCDGCSPVKALARAGLLGPNVLAIHANYLARGDAQLLAQKKASVVHCPRSHDFFSHDAFPYRALANAGVNVCLGTDSLATVRKKPRREVELNLFDEMRLFSEKNPQVHPEEILRMVTVNGAKALGMSGKIGELSHNARADLIALPFDGKATEAAATVIQHPGPVSVSMIDGQWALPLAESFRAERQRNERQGNL